MVTIFDRLHPAFGAFFAGCLIMSGSFAAIALAGYDPMPNVVYGDVGTADALSMATCQAVAAGIGLSGAFRKSRLMCGIGGAALGVLFMALASYAAVALPGSAAVMSMSFGAAPISLSIAFYSFGGRRGV